MDIEKQGNLVAKLLRRLGLVEIDTEPEPLEHDACDAGVLDSLDYHECEPRWTQENTETHLRRCFAPGVLYGGYR